MSSTPPNVRTGNVSELIPDPNNANLGTERGHYALEYSLSNLGAGRSVLVDKNYKLIAGNKTHATAGAIGLEDTIVVDTKGDKLVVVRRIDLDADDPAAQQLAIADNRVGELNLRWSAEQFQTWEEEGVPLDNYFRPEEVQAIILPGTPADADLDPPDDDTKKPPKPADGDKFPLAIVLSWKNHQRWQRLKGQLGHKRDGDAFLEALERLEGLLG